MGAPEDRPAGVTIAVQTMASGERRFLVEQLGDTPCPEGATLVEMISAATHMHMLTQWDRILHTARLHDEVGVSCGDPSNLLAHLASQLVIREWRGVPRGGVYLIQSGDDGPVKIGTSRAIAQRYDALKTGSPVPLALRAVIPGDIRVEHALHRRYAEHWLHGEWFAPHSDILDLIAKGRVLPSVEIVGAA